MLQALDAADETLGESAFTQLNGFYQAIWQGKQNLIDDYPSELRMTGEFDDDSWNFLLQLPDIDRLSFWSSLSPSLELEQIVRLDDKTNPENFSHLLDAKSSGIHIKSLMVNRYQPTLEENPQEDKWKWEVMGDEESKHLTLHDSRLIIYFADHASIEKDHFPKDAKLVQRDGISIRTFKSRVKTVQVDEVQISTGEKVTISDIPNGSIEQSSALDKLESVGVVTSASVHDLTKTQKINIHFDIGKASVSTSAKPTLPDVVNVATPILEQLPPPRIKAMKERFFKIKKKNESDQLEPDI